MISDTIELLSDLESGKIHDKDESSNRNQVTKPYVRCASYVTDTVYDYNGYAWFAAICCFCPVGWLAVRKSRQTKKAIEANDYYKAEQLAEQTRQYSLCSTVIGVLMIAVTILVLVTLNIQ